MGETTTDPKILPPMGLLMAILWMCGFHFLLPITQIVPGYGRLAGLFPVALGIVISSAAEKQFQRAGTTVNPFQESSQFIREGLYRFSRNPMYLGMVLILAGMALLLGSLTPFGMIPLFMIWIQTQFIRGEEQRLATQFGQDWLEYKAHVRRWI